MAVLLIVWNAKIWNNNKWLCTTNLGSIVQSAFIFGELEWKMGVAETLCIDKIVRELLPNRCHVCVHVYL